MKQPIFCFDIDGTLLSTGGAGSRSIKKAVNTLFQKEIDWKSIVMAGQLDPSIYRQILLKLDLPYKEKQWEEFLNLYLSFLEEEKHNVSSWVVFDGVLETLKILSQNKAKMILITGNIKKGAWVKLYSCHLHAFFDWDNSIFGDDGKESRDELAFAYLKKHKDFLPIIIGDTPHDIRVGELTGGMSIAVCTGMHSKEELSLHNPHYNLLSLKEFPWHEWPHLVS